MFKESKIEEIAKKIVAYNPKKGKVKNGYLLSHKPTAYGLVLKYIFGMRDLTYKEAGNILGYSSQNINNLVNRTENEHFDEFTVERLCNKLFIDKKYFMQLVELVNELI
jgi:hypothetical protein